MFFHYTPAISQDTRDAIFLRMQAEGLLGCAMSALAAPTLADWRHITSPRRGLLLCCYGAGGNISADKNKGAVMHTDDLAASPKIEALHEKDQAPFTEKLSPTASVKIAATANTATTAKNSTAHIDDVDHGAAPMLGCALFTPRRGKVWEFDCTAFRTATRLAARMALGGLAWAFTHLDCAAIVGLCPAPNRHAWRLAEACGFRVMGRLPQACWHARKQRHVDGVLVLCTPHDLPEHADVEKADADVLRRSRAD